jgi:cytochrome c6
MIIAKKILAMSIAIMLALSFWITPSVLADDIVGEKLFQANCAGCHDRGGNIVRRGKNLKLKTLQKNRLDSLESIAQLVTNGKNNMPAYRDRLNDKEIQAVSIYVLQQAEQNWH